jgi:pyruvate/2-oxoacid:ferredoxin oxidoreductase beta subunit
MGVINGPFPYSAVKQPFLHTAFATGASTASGIRAALDIQRKQKINVVVIAGDGGTFDIGLQSLSGAAERDENIIYVCNDNEAYMNTGGQRSSATPLGAWTSTTPGVKFKERPKKNIMDIMIAHRIPYAATASIAYPRDLIYKLKKAANIKGFRFIHILSTCPTGWKYPPELSIKLARLAVETRIFPLYEVEEGISYKIKKTSKNTLVGEYLFLQGRFKHLDEKAVKIIQNNVDCDWNILLKKASYNS